MGDHRRDLGGTIPKKYAQPIYAHYPAGCCHGLDLLVSDVPLMVMQGARIGVTENAGFGREFHRLKARLDPAMGAIHDHADTVHFAHDGPPEIRKSFVLIVTTAARVAVQRSHSLDVERQRHLSGMPRRENLRKR